MPSAKESIRASDVVALLKARYPPPAFAFLEQVADGTGLRQSRWADAVAMSVWPSRGYYLEGFEVKVSRSDFLSEIRNPAKADALMRYCMHWWMVVGDASIVRDGELPKTWGLMAVKSGKLRVAVCAPTLTPEPFDTTLTASILRNAAVSDANLLKREFQRGERAGMDMGTKRDREKIAELTKAILGFEEASGLKIDSYSGPQMGKSVKLVQHLSWDVDSILRAKDQAQRIADGLKELAGLSDLANIVTKAKESNP